jgi:hypothetical protein
MSVVHEFFANTYVRRALVGAGGAAVADLHAVFALGGWKNFARYDWGTASWRWFLGALTGLGLGAGVSALS